MTQLELNNGYETIFPNYKVMKMKNLILTLCAFSGIICTQALAEKQDKTYRICKKWTTVSNIETSKGYELVELADGNIIFSVTYHYKTSVCEGDGTLSLQIDTTKRPSLIKSRTGGLYDVSDAFNEPRFMRVMKTSNKVMLEFAKNREMTHESSYDWVNSLHVFTENDIVR